MASGELSYPSADTTTGGMGSTVQRTNQTKHHVSYKRSEYKVFSLPVTTPSPNLKKRTHSPQSPDSPHKRTHYTTLEDFDKFSCSIYGLVSDTRLDKSGSPRLSRTSPNHVSSVCLCIHTTDPPSPMHSIQSALNTANKQISIIRDIIPVALTFLENYAEPVYKCIFRVLAL